MSQLSHAQFPLRRHPNLLVDHRRSRSAAVAEPRGANGEAVTDPGGRLQIGMVAGIKSERWPTSNRNPRPDCVRRAFRRDVPYAKAPGPVPPYLGRRKWRIRKQQRRSMPPENLAVACLRSGTRRCIAPSPPLCGGRSPEAAPPTSTPITLPVGPTSSAAGIAEAPVPQPTSRITPPKGKERRSKVRLPCLAQKERGSLSKWSAAALYVIAAFSAGPGVSDMIFDLGCAYSLARRRSRA